MESKAFSISDPPGLKDLMKVAEKIGANLSDFELTKFGLELLPEGEVKEIQGNSSNEELKKLCLEMLKKWKGGKDYAFLDDVVGALRKIDKHEVARIIEEAKQPSSTQLGKRPADKQDEEDQVTKRHRNEIDEIDFSKYKDVVVAFTKLMTTFEDNVSKDRLKAIKNSCVRVTEGKFQKCIETQRSLSNFFTLLSKNTQFCNCIEVRLLEIIAVASGNEKLEDLIQKYKAEVYSRKLRQVWEYIPQLDVRTKYYSKVEVMFDSKTPDDVTVKQLVEYNKELANEIALRLMCIKENCLNVTWLVPTDKVYELFLFALTPQRSRQDDFLQIGAWTAYRPQVVLKKLKIEFAMASPSTLAIGYYHGLLLRDIDFSVLMGSMCSKNLITEDAQNLISTGHSVYQKKWLLFEHVRSKENTFLEFCKLILELWPNIGSQLNIVVNTMKSQPVVKDVTAEIHSAMHDQCYNPSLLHIAFLSLIDEVSELLPSGGVKKLLIEQCKSIMASEQNNIKLFSNNQIEKMNKCFYATTPLQALSYLFTWSNHSILRVLLAMFSSKAVEILNEFDSKFNSLQSIASYPVPYFSSEMIPDDTSIHTILAIRCDQELYKSTFQYVYDIQSVMMEKCDITEHCLQLLAFRYDPTVLYWTIPKCIVNLIKSQVPQHSEYLYSKGVLEVMVYPELSLIIDDDLRIGSLAFVTEIKDNDTEKDKGELSISQCGEYVGQRGENDFTTTGEVEGTSMYDYAYTVKRTVTADQKHNTKESGYSTVLSSKSKVEVTDGDPSKFVQGVPDKDIEMVAASSTNEEIIKKHTIHRFLHYPDTKCNLCETMEECQNKYHNGFANKFQLCLDDELTTNEFFKYMDMHLQAKKCPEPCSRLWKYCLGHKLLGNVYLNKEWFNFFQYAPKGLLIYSMSRKNLEGTVVDTYFGYTDLEPIASGGFGKVYKLPCEKAVKDEYKRPLITNGADLFHQIMELDHPNVIRVLEYIAGPDNNKKEGHKSFLSVMSFKSQQGFHKQFDGKLTCVLDYMKEYRNQEKFIFRNYTVLFQHIFKGLCYFKSKSIIHRDIKLSNILVHQTCQCESPLQCTCDQGVTYLLGDLDLCIPEGQQKDLPYTNNEWEKMADRDPAGTVGMKPPESFFRSEEGEHVLTHKSDVWSACVTMMNALIGSVENTESHKQNRTLITASRRGIDDATMSVTDSLDLVHSSITMFKPMLCKVKEKQDHSGLVNNEMSTLSMLDKNLNKLKDWLSSGKKSLNQSQSFRGEDSEIYREENPLARILTTAHEGQNLYWKCAKELQHVYGKQLWTVIELTLDAVVAGIQVSDKKRDDAENIVRRLEEIPQVDCSDSYIEN